MANPNYRIKPVKTASDPRHLHRQKMVQELFAWSTLPANKTKNIPQIVNRIRDIDKIITKFAPEWETDKIYKADLAILRLAIYELAFAKTEPLKVVIDEAIELAKEFGNETSPSFINGVLGAYLKNDYPIL